MNHEAQTSSSRVEVDYDCCSYCGACVPVCPSGSIVLHDATILIDQTSCTRCERCVIVCPTGALVCGVTNEAQL
jgi:ferredoxin